MTPSKTIIIALGSNKGNKFENLQEALMFMHQTLGTIKKISKVYKSPAVGFEGDEFLNACVKLTTQLKPKKILKHLLEIETKLGRVRTEGKDYESRTLDLDLLFYDNQVIKTETLQVPHPRLQERKFVLMPLQDIDSKWEHPVLKKTMAELLETCADDTQVLPQNIWLKNPLKSYCWSQHNFIANNRVLFHTSTLPLQFNDLILDHSQIIHCQRMSLLKSRPFRAVSTHLINNILHLGCIISDRLHFRAIHQFDILFIDSRSWTLSPKWRSDKKCCDDGQDQQSYNWWWQTIIVFGYTTQTLTFPGFYCFLVLVIGG